MNLGAMIDQAYELREQKKALDEQSKALSAQIEELRVQILASMDEQGMHTTSAHHAQAIATEMVVPRIVDWDAAIEWIMDNEAAYLIQRRISSSAYKEMLNSGEQIPGVEPFTKRDISLRKLTRGT